MARRISEGRKAVYYTGIVIGVVGFLTFGSVFVSAADMNPGDPGWNSRSESMGLRAVLGMGLMIAGGIMAVIGSRGAAGSGLVLDPEKAREDLEPFSRQAGGMVKDALDEADIHLGREPPETKVVVRCRACAALNDEDAKFCKACGKPV
jgi:hypothetical protein